MRRWRRGPHSANRPHDWNGATQPGGAGDPPAPVLGPVEGRSYGLVIEWCETRGDCTYGVVCPDTGQQFVIDDDELTELEQWTDAQGHALVCGVRWEQR